MGFSVSAAFAVTVIAGFIALGLVYPAVSGGFESVSQASQDAGDRRLNAINTDINVTSACIDTSNQLRVDIDNVGATDLNANRTHVLVNNDYQLSFVSRTVDGNSGQAVWAPGHTLTLVYSFSEQRVLEIVPVDPGRVTVATEHGVRESLETVPC